MKRLLPIAGIISLAVWLAAQNAAALKPLAEITPSGALLYLEARNFSALLRDWDASAEKKTWTAGDNYQVFSRSRLYLRLNQVFEEYSKATGVPPDLTLLRSVAGGESAMAIYDVSNLEFLYVTRLPAARAMESVLFKAKEKFVARNAAGTAYYSKTDGATRRTASFAIAGDLLLLATREEALTGALGLIAGGNGTPIRREPWFDEAAKATGAPGELRLVTNMEKLLRSPSFRSYWIQRNVPDLRQYSAGIGDLVRSAAEFREDRVLLRQDAIPAPDATAVAGLLRLTQNAGLYRAWAQPDPEFSLSMISAKILRPGPGGAAESRVAPAVSLEAGLRGDEADLETRIDGAPYEPPGVIYRPERLRELLAANRPQALLQLQSSRVTADRVFVANDSAVVLHGSSEWDEAAVRGAIRHAVEGLYTTSGIGVDDGLARIGLAVRGRLLLLSSRPGYLEPLLPLLQAAPQGAGGTYVAGYRAAAEVPDYTRIMRLIEAPQGTADQPQGEPPLFSANLSSLARTLQRVQSVAVLAHDNGRLVKQTVSYRLGR